MLRRPGFWLTALAVLLCAAQDTAAQGCKLFCPARQDISGILEPIIVLPGDLDEQGTPDLITVSEEIPGDSTRAAVTVFLADGSGGYVQVSYRVIDGSPTGASLGQLNGDQHLDLAVTHFLGSSVSILPGTGSGSFGAPQVLPLAGTPTAVKAVEFTGDAWTDLVIVTAPTGFPGTARILRGDGAGGFVQISTAPVDKDPRGIYVADFDRNGTKDLSVANRTGQSVSVIPGTGGGQLGASIDVEIGASANSIAGGDLNGDQYVDLITGGPTVGSSVVPLLGDGAGGFVPGAPVALGSDVPSLATCDIDRDGTLDVIAAKFTSDTVSLLRGVGNGSFQPPTDMGANSGPRSISAGDLNNDGFCDAVSANQVGGSLSLFAGDGLGNVGTPSFTAGDTPLYVAAGDLDGDLLPDVVTADRDSNTITVFRGDGEGGMIVRQILAAGPYPGAVTIRDVTGDGIPEIVVANQGPPSSTQTSTVDVYERDGSGTFSFLAGMSAGRLPLDVISEDFDNDGTFDIAVANGNSDNVSVFLSQGGGGFGSRKNSRTGMQPRALVALHVDADGFLDLAVSEGMDNRINILLGEGNGTFTEAGASLPGGGLNVDDVIAADLDGDGRRDLAWIDQHGVSQPSTVSIFLHDGGSWFVEAPSSDLPTGTFAEGLAAIDLDRLSGLDIAAVNRFDDTAQVWFGDGAGGFTSGGVFGTGHEPFAIAVSDVNGDGRDDLVSADFSGDAVSVLLNNTFIDLNFETLLPLSQTEFGWQPFPGADSYNIYRGDAGLLRLRDYGSCFSSVTSTSFTDTEVPASGGIFLYLATAVMEGWETPMGVTSSCLKRPNRHPCGAP